MTATQEQPRVIRLEQADDGAWWMVYADGARRGVQHTEHTLAKYSDVPHVAMPSTAGQDWIPRDLDGYLNGTHVPPKPALLRRQDAAFLVYPGRVHWVSGEPEAGKSWLGLLACAQALWDDQEVVYLDLEDGPAGITQRLLDLGVTPDAIRERFHYVQPESALSPIRRELLEPYIARSVLLVIDACTESLAQQGLSSKDDTDIAQWLEILPRWAARLGPAVLVLDHVVKDAESRGRWATGSQHKLSGLDGVAYSVETVNAAGRGLTGRSRLFVSKDRHGQVRGPITAPTAGGKHWVGDLVIDSSGPMLEVLIYPPTTVDASVPFLPTVVMTKVSAVLEAAGKPLTKAALESRVGGRATVVRNALAELEDAGHITVSTGPNNSRLHTLVKPYPTPEEGS